MTGSSVATYVHEIAALHSAAVKKYKEEEMTWIHR